MKASIVFNFSQKVLNYSNLLNLIVRRKIKEFESLYPNYSQVSLSITYNGDDFVSNRSTLVISGYAK